MSTIQTDETLAAIVTGHPELARDLERLGLDYCCGGRRPLAEACDEKGLDARQVAAELSSRAGPRAPEPWASMEPAALVDHLEATHHAYLHAELPRLEALSAKVLGAHGARHPELAGVHEVVVAIRADLEPHLMKEERILFPMVRQLAAAPEGTPVALHCGSLANPVSVMLAEHDRTGEVLEVLRDRTGGYAAPPDGCASYGALYAGLAELEADTHLHVHKENNLLFPAVLAMESGRA